MPNNVDKRVVKMEFDNEVFERKVKTTRESLGKLQNDLNFDKHVSKVNNLKNAVNSFSVQGMASGIETIASKFDAMGVVGFTVIQNLTNAALGFGKKILSSTFGQMITGGRSRALNLEQAQFQISGLGVDWKSTANEFGVALYDQIDKAVSGTAYGLDAAAKVAGQLLASNIKAGSAEMQSALSGISGVAAMTNSTYEDIGDIFTKIAGNGRLMGDQLNQLAGRGLNAAATIADYLTKVGNGAKVTEADVREMVSKGKIDFQTFSNAMNEAFGEQATKANETYTGSLSNVKAALSRIGEKFQVPYLENMRKVFVGLIPVLDGIKNSLKPMFEVAAKGMEFIQKDIVQFLNKFAKFDENGKKVFLGITKFEEKVKKAFEIFNNKTFVDNLKNIYESIKSIFISIGKLIGAIVGPFSKGIKSAFFGAGNPVVVFVQTVSRALTKVSTFIANFVEKVKAAVNENDELFRIAKGIGAAFRIAWTLVKSVLGILGGVGKAAAPVVKWLLKIGASIGDFVVHVQQALDKSTVFKATLSTIGEIFAGIGKVFSAVTTKISQGFKAIKDGFGGVDTSLISKISNVLRGFIDVIKEFVTRLGDAFFGDSIKTTTGLLDKLTSVGIIATFLSLKKQFKKGGGILSSLTKSLNNIASSIDGILKNIKNIFGILGDTLKSFNKKLKAEMFYTVAKAMLVLVAALFILSTIDSDALANSIVTMGLLFTELALFFKSFNKAAGGGNTSKLVASAFALEVMAGAILILSGAIKILAKLPLENALGGVLAVSILLEVLVGVIKQLTSGDAVKRLPKGIASLIAIAIAVRILVNAVSKLAALSWEELGKGMAGVAALIAMLIGFVRGVGKPSKMLSTATALLVLSVAMEVFVHCVKRLSKMSWEELAKGELALAAIFLMLGLFVKTIDKLKASVMAKLLAVSTSMIILGGALEILVHVCKRLGQIDTGQLIQGVVALGVLFTEVAAFTRLVGKPKRIISIALSMIAMGAAMEILADVIQKLSAIPIGHLAAAVGGLTVLMAALVGFVAATRTFGTVELLAKSIALVVFASALKSLGEAVVELGSVSIGGIVKAVGTILVLLTAVYIFCKKIGKDIADIGIVVSAILALAVGIKMLASVPIIGAAVAVATLAATFATLALGVKLLKPHIKTLSKLAVVVLKFAGSLALMGLSMLAFGAGLVLVGAGITSLVLAAKELPTILVPLFTALRDSAPLIVEFVFAILNSILDALDEFIPKLLDTVRKAVINVIDTCIELLPKIMEFLDKLIDFVGPLLIDKIPQVVDIVLEFVIQVLDRLITKVPTIIVKVVDLINAIFKGLGDAIRKLNPGSIVTLIAGFAAMAIIFKYIASMKNVAKDALIAGLSMALVFGALAAIFVIVAQFDIKEFGQIAAGMGVAIIGMAVAIKLLGNVNPAGAAYAVAAIAIFIAGLTAIVAALGGLKQIPGFDWLISEGFSVLAAIGKGIGEFIGSFVGGIASGFAKVLPEIADQLSIFAVKIKPFLAVLKDTDWGVLRGAAAICGAILAFTVTEFIHGILNFFGGGIDFGRLGEELCVFGDGLVEFSKTIAGKIDTKAVAAAAEAGKAIAQMAASMPNEGGVLGWIMGENSLSVITPQLVPFAEGLADFSKAISSKVNLKQVETACNAGKLIAEMASTLPNEGGVVGWFVGENSLGIIAPQLAPFGQGLADFSAAVAGGKIDVDAIVAAVECAQALADMAQTIPNQGGIVAWFTGDNKLEDWAPQLKPFGEGLREFSDAVGGGKLNPDDMAGAVEAAKGIVELSNHIPDQGGIASWFSGDNKLEDWAPQLKPFGEGIAALSAAVSGKLDAEAIMVAARAGVAISEMCDHVPKEGGFAAWFSGEQSLSKFAGELAPLGRGLSEFSAAVSGNIDSEQVKVAAEAGKTISEMCDHIPAENGVVAWFAGEKSISKFADEIPKVAEALVKFSKTIKEGGGIDTEGIKMAAEAGKLLAEMCDDIPNQDGVVAWFTGDNKLEDWAPQLPIFAENLQKTSRWLKSLTERDFKKLDNLAVAGKALVKLSDDIPNQDGVVAWFTGDNKLSDWADELPPFGAAMNKLCKSVSGMTEEDAKRIESLVKVSKGIVEMSNNTPKEGGIQSWFGGDHVSLEEIGKQMAAFGLYLVEIFKRLPNTSTTVVNSFVYMLTAMTKALAFLSAVGDFNPSLVSGDTSLSNLGAQLYEFGKYMGDVLRSLPNYRPETVNLLSSMLYGIARALSVMSGVDLTNVTNVKSHLTGMADSMKSLSDVGETVKFELVRQMTTAMARVFTALEEMPNTSEVAAIKSLTDYLGPLVEATVGFINKGASLDVTKIQNGMKAYQAVIDTVKSLPTNLNDSVISVLEEIRNFDFSDFINASLNVDKVKKGGEAFVQGFVTGASNYRLTAIESLKKIFVPSSGGTTSILGAMIQSIESVTTTNKFKNAMKKLCDEMAAGMENKRSTLKSKIESLVSTMSNTADNKYQVFYNIGLNWCRGLANGIYSGEIQVTNAAKSVADATKNVTMSTLKEQSPSRVGEEIGMNWDLGLAGGIATYGKAVTTASQMVSKDTIATTAALIDTVSNMEFDDMQYSPTITPVLDTSGVATGVRAINSLMSATTSYSIASDVAAQRARLSKDERTIHVETNNKDVVDEVKALKSEISDLRSAISSMGLYLDGRTLVGGIIDDVDEKLGHRATRVRRVGK